MFSNFSFKSILQNQILIWKSGRRLQSTIYALSSGLGKSGVAVYRISGKDTNQIFQSMVRFPSTPKPRMAYLKTIYDPGTGEPLDKGLILWFPEPRSFTGEDMCELQIHGSKAVIEAVSSALSKLKGFRPAEPGEFTKRAFQAGKLSLTEVEGLLDLINAETEMQRKQALNQMDGCLEQLYADWRKIILENLALTEAFIDFSEDQNIEDDILDQVDKNLRDLSTRLQDHLNDGRKGEILRDGVKTVIIGSTNVGKSSLLNLLCRRPAAIVTEIAGTTRDVIQGAVNINGYPVLLSDTAGIRQEPTQDTVEREGIRRSFDEASKADLLLLVVDAQHVFSCTTVGQEPEPAVSSYLNTYTESLGILKLLEITKHLIVFNKCDLIDTNQLKILQQYSLNKGNIIGLSCKSSLGVPTLLNSLTESFKLICGLPDRSNPSCSRQRHRYHLTECEKFIAQYLDIMNEGDPESKIVFAAEKLRQAVRHLGMISGIVATDEVLSVIFKQFCVDVEAIYTSLK